jgi:inner membrane protein
MNKTRVHPIQYLFIGLAIIIFYSLLISISEHTNFDFAYIISSVAIIVMISGYAKSILKNKYITGIVAGILFILYAYLYLLLQLEDYALLMGSIGLFVVLGLVMYLTRKIDWYSIRSEE